MSVVKGDRKLSELFGTISQGLGVYTIPWTKSTGKEYTIGKEKTAGILIIFDASANRIAIYAVNIRSINPIYEDGGISLSDESADIYVTLKERRVCIKVVQYANFHAKFISINH